MDEETIKTTVQSYLISTGLEVERIPEDPKSKMRRPDLCARDTAGQKYIVEIKTKVTAPESVEKYQQQLAKGQVVHHKDRTGRKNIISGILKNASRQLDAFASTTDLRIVWVHAAGWDTQLQCMQIRSSVFGSAQLIDLSQTHDDKECFFFGDSDFFLLRRSVDAVVISMQQFPATLSREMFLNNYSPRSEILWHSEFVRAFGTVIVDPIALEKAGEIYIADCSLPRSNSNAILDYVRRKYNRPRLIDMHPRALSTTIRR